MIVENNKRKETSEELEIYKTRLKKIISTKIQTTMIFPLSQFEAAFGTLWRQGVAEEKLTDEELVWRRKWEQCRNNILNNGNQQKRNAMTELNMYEVIWSKYKTEFRVTKDTVGYINIEEESDNLEDLENHLDKNLKEEKE